MTQNFQQSFQYGTIRYFWRSLFLTFITFGIYYFFYQWQTFRDLEDHYQKAFSYESESFPTKNNSTTLFIFLFFLPIYSYYIKYRLLHEHIRTSPVTQNTNCLAGYTAVIGFTLFSIPTLGIFPIVVEARWQKAFNEHILAHEELG